MPISVLQNWVMACMQVNYGNNAIYGQYVSLDLRDWLAMDSHPY